MESVCVTHVNIGSGTGLICCLRAPVHYLILNQCWLLINGALWHSSEFYFTVSAQTNILYEEIELLKLLLCPSELNHCCLLTPYGDINLGQHWLRLWLAAWRHQAITWTNVDLSSVRSTGIHLRAILQEIPQPSVSEISLKITYLKFCSKLPGANELREVWRHLNP